MKILIIGTGHVGLVTGVCFAEMGHKVTCLDIDQERIDLLKKGISPIYEIGLQEMLIKNLTEGHILFTTDYKKAVGEAEIIFLALPTPPREDGSSDLSFLKNAVLKVAKLMENYCLIVTKSTVPIGTGHQVQKWIEEELQNGNKEISFDVASNPEFLQEGCAITNFMKPDRIIIGVQSQRAEELLRNVYKPLMVNGVVFLSMDILSAEMNKYAANAMLACRISFMNELATICEKIGVDVQKVQLGMSKDKRIGSEFLSPGVGFGGSCFTKDLSALTNTAKNKGAPCPILEAIVDVNERQRGLMAELVEKFFSPEGVKNKIIAIWGLSFKPDTEDIREAPSLPLIDSLLKKGAQLRLFDPMAMPSAKKVVDSSQIYWANDELDALQGVDALILMTEWKQFRSFDFAKAIPLMRQLVCFDGRNQYDPQEMKKLGFHYFSIGRPIIT